MKNKTGSSPVQPPRLPNYHRFFCCRVLIFYGLPENCPAINYHYTRFRGGAAARLRTVNGRVIIKSVAAILYYIIIIGRAHYYSVIFFSFIHCYSFYRVHRQTKIIKYKSRINSVCGTIVSP